jgi:hypothetical protein
VTDKELLANAAPGPWFVEPMHGGPAGLTAITNGVIGVIGSTLTPEDAALIVHMRTEYPALLARLARVTEEVNGMMDSLDDHVIADDDERNDVYTALRNVYQVATGDLP